MWPSTVILDTVFGCNITRGLVLLLGWRHYVRSDYETSTVWDANGNLLQILTAVILRIQFRSVVYKVICFDC